MDKSSSKKRKKSCRSRSSSLSREDHKHQRKRRLKEIKQENLTRTRTTDALADSTKVKRKASHREDYRGECFDNKIEKSRNKEKQERRKKELSDSGSNSSSALGSELEIKSKKLKKRKAKKRKSEKRKKGRKRKEGRKGRDDRSSLKDIVQNEDVALGPMPVQLVIPQVQATEAKKRQPMLPMTKEEYEKQQSKMKRVFDPDTGRNRLVRGDGEIIEEVVSYQRHKEINQLATMGDGASFQKSLGLHK